MLVVTGLNHESAPEEVRERAAFIKRTALEALGELTRDVEEAIVLSTCNRSEIYVYTEDGQAGAALLKSFYEKKDPTLTDHLYTYTGREALLHLYRLACGLDSMVLGEDQILGQLKEAEELARRGGYTGKYLSQFFREAITFSKRIKTQYKLSQVPQSLSASAVKYVKRRYPDYAKKRVLVVGSGRMGRLALKHLGAEGFENVAMSNRTYHPGDEYAELYEALTTVDYHARYDELKRTDIVLSATSSPHTIFRAEKIPELDHPVLFIDLALPKDVDRRIGERENAEVLGIDDFKATIKARHSWQLEQVKKIESEIGPAVDSLLDWAEHTEVDALLKQINTQARAQAEETIRLLNKRYAFSGKDLKYLEKIVRSGFSGLVKPTLLKLKKLEPDEVDLVTTAAKIVDSKQIVRKNE